MSSQCVRRAQTLSSATATGGCRWSPCIGRTVSPLTLSPRSPSPYLRLSLFGRRLMRCSGGGSVRLTVLCRRRMRRAVRLPPLLLPLLRVLLLLGGCSQPRYWSDSAAAARRRVSPVPGETVLAGSPLRRKASSVPNAQALE